MQIKISKSDVLESLRFGIIAAEEELQRVTGHINEVTTTMLGHGDVMAPDKQIEMGRALTDARDHLRLLNMMRRMAEFARDDEEILLDVETFAIIEHNLPAR